MLPASSVIALAAVAAEPKRTALYEKMVALYPGYAEYQHQTTRVIPVVTLTYIN